MTLDMFEDGEPMKRRRRYRKRTENFVKTVCKLWEGGMTIRAIADEYGYKSDSVIRDIITDYRKKKGIPIKGKGSRSRIKKTVPVKQTVPVKISKPGDIIPVPNPVNDSVFTKILKALGIR